MKLNHYTYMEPKTLVLFVLVRETETQTVTRDYHVGLSSARFLSFPFFLLISSGTFMSLLLVFSFFLKATPGMNVRCTLQTSYIHSKFLFRIIWGYRVVLGKFLQSIWYSLLDHVYSNLRRQRALKLSGLFELCFAFVIFKIQHHI